MNELVVEYRSNELITIGLNSLRELCSRMPEALDREKLNRIEDLRFYKNKSVSIAATSVINLYRDIAPETLDKKLR